jgi:molecular chaperone GrpE (heat shock protein)
VSCYLRHLKDILDEAGIAVTAVNRRQVDRAIHQVVGVAYKNCPAAWKRIKEEIKSDEEKRQAFIQQLRTAMR